MKEKETFIYITFDDGPLNGTKSCYSLVRTMNIKASFFMVGIHADNTRGKSLVTLIKEAYPTILIANHSYSHANEKYNAFYKNPEIAFQDFIKAEKTLMISNKIIRLPGNSAWAIRNKIKASSLVMPLSQKLYEAGYNIIGWDVEFKIERNSKFLLKSVVNSCYLDVKRSISMSNSFTANHIVILFHDWMFQNEKSLDALAYFIQLLKSNDNYHFETVDNYPFLQ